MYVAKTTVRLTLNSSSVEVKQEREQASAVMLHYLGKHPKVLSDQLAKLMSLDSLMKRHEYHTGPCPGSTFASNYESPSSIYQGAFPDSSYITTMVDPSNMAPPSISFMNHGDPSYCGSITTSLDKSSISNVSPGLANDALHVASIMVCKAAWLFVIPVSGSTPFISAWKRASVKSPRSIDRTSITSWASSFVVAGGVTTGS